jgi:hypothetical protein
VTAITRFCSLSEGAQGKPSPARGAKSNTYKINRFKGVSSAASRSAGSGQNFRPSQRDYLQYVPSFAASVSAPVAGILSDRGPSGRNSLRRLARVPARAEKSPGSTDDCIIAHLGIERRAGRSNARKQTGGHDGPERRTVAGQDLKRGVSYTSPLGVGYRRAREGRRPEELQSSRRLNQPKTAKAERGFVNEARFVSTRDQAPAIEPSQTVH